MLDLSTISIQKLIIHYVGNKSKEEKVYLSKEEFSSFDDQATAGFLAYFISPFAATDQLYNFFHPADIGLNQMRTLCQAFFEAKTSFRETAEKIAVTLYDHSEHPNINSGEVFIAQFTGSVFNGEAVNAIGVYKSESKETFLKVQREDGSYDYDIQRGINIKNVDKGCIIFDTLAQGEYTVGVIDNTNKSRETKYWSDDFLKLISCQDSFHFTREYLDVAKKFVVERMPEVFELSKADKIDYLNKSIGYFKNNQHFNEEDFLDDVFQHKEVINSFNDFKEDYANTNELSINDDFDISKQAVKKQARVFKSVLKLDKNFHIYIHGKKDLIEKGVDNDGRKFYKIYYEREF